MTPWSVRAHAVIPESFIFFTRSGILLIPSKRLYSPWTCKWTNPLFVLLIKISPFFFISCKMKKYKTQQKCSARISGQRDHLHALRSIFLYFLFPFCLIWYIMIPVSFFIRSSGSMSCLIRLQTPQEH